MRYQLLKRMPSLGTRTVGLGLILTFVALVSFALPIRQAAAAANNQYSMQEIVDAGHSFFGSTSGGLAKVVERAFQQFEDGEFFSATESRDDMERRKAAWHREHQS